VNFYCCKETQTEYSRDTKEALEKGLKFMSRLDNTTWSAWLESAMATPIYYHEVQG